MALQYEIIDTAHPKWKGRRFADRARAEKYVHDSETKFGAPKGRFIVRDRSERKSVK